MLIKIKSLSGKEQLIDIRKDEIKNETYKYRNGTQENLYTYFRITFDYEINIEIRIKNNAKILSIDYIDKIDSDSGFNIDIKLRDLTDAESLIEFSDDNMEYIVSIEKIKLEDKNYDNYYKNTKGLKDFSKYFNVSVDTSKVDIPNI